MSLYCDTIRAQNNFRTAQIVTFIIWDDSSAENEDTNPSEVPSSKIQFGLL